MLHNGAFLGAVPVVEVQGRSGRRNSRGLEGVSPRSPSTSRLGQFGLPNLVDLPGVPGATPGGTSQDFEPRCYKCGLGTPTLMAPTTAAFNPSCVEVDRALCGAIPPTGTDISPNTTDTVALLTVFEPEELGPMPNADVTVLQLHPVDLAPREITTGVTDAEGKYAFRGELPRYVVNRVEHAGSLRFVVSPGDGTPSFPEVSTDVRVMGQSTPPSFVVACPAGTKPVTCEVAKAQTTWSTVYQQQLLAWNYWSSGQPPQIAAFAGDMAHAAVMNGIIPKDPRLAKHWMTTYSWWVGDLGIPPKDWDKLLDWSDQVAQIFAKIPFPQWSGIEDYFTRCARGIPITTSPDGEKYAIASPRLYSETYSDYFPTTDEKINMDMATAYLLGLKSVFACILHKIKKKIRGIERTVRAMSIISLSITVMASPFLIGVGGKAGVVVLGTEVYEFVSQMRGPGIEAQGTTAVLAAALLSTGNAAFVTAALTPVIDALLVDMDPLAATAVREAYPQIIQSALDTVLGPAGIGTGASDFLTLQAIGSAAAVMAVKMLAGIPKMYAAQRIEEFGDVQLGTQAAASDFMAIKNYEEVSPEMKPFFGWVADALKFPEMFDEAIDEALDQIADAAGIGTDQGGGITIVPEEGGGGVDIVPTDSEGVPTDSEGVPLPGGVTPSTPLVTKPAVSTEVGTAIGVGGAALLVAAATGIL